jgi:hypothetical protein
LKEVPLDRLRRWKTDAPIWRRSRPAASATSPPSWCTPAANAWHELKGVSRADDHRRRDDGQLSSASSPRPTR